MTRMEIIKAAEVVSPIGGAIGSFVSTDGEWCTCTTPAKFRAYLEKLGFQVVKCESTSFSTAIAQTADGYVIAYNGSCTKRK